MLRWEVIIALALVFTASFTPFEIAFLELPQSFLDSRFLINRLVDGIFCIDVFMRFVSAPQGLNAESLHADFDTMQITC